MQLVKGYKNGPSVPLGIAVPPFPESYKYGGLSLWVRWSGDRPTACHVRKDDC